MKQIHKPKDYWANFENCENAAKTCRNRSEFYKKFSRAAMLSKQYGWIDKFDKYFSIEKRFHDFNEPVHIVYAYLFTETHFAYVGRTLKLKRRDAQHRYDQNDTLYKYAEENSLAIPSPILLETGLKALESREKEHFYTEKYRNEGWNILNKAKTGKHSGSLGSTMRIWTYEHCKEVAKNCINKPDYRKKYPTAHRVATVNHWIDDFFDNVKKPTGYFDCLPNCIKESGNYRNLTHIKHDYPFLYHKICEHNYNDEIKKYLATIKHEIPKKGNDDIFNDFEFVTTENYMPFIDKKINILIPSAKIGIEYDGLKWHTEWFGKKDHMYHLNKTIKCNEKGYGLIHVFEDEYENHKELVENKIKHILKVEDNEIKIGARKCTVKEINKSVSNDFLEKYHIQGKVSASVYYGAYYNNELIGVMTFKKEAKDGFWELSRYATDYHYICQGLGSKMFRHFIRENNPIEVKSFADRRWTVSADNNLYTKLGFKLENTLRPDYRYYNEEVDRFQRFHKFGFRKQILNKKYGLPLTMTETQMVQELGYDRIWDCGLFKYVWRGDHD